MRKALAVGALGLLVGFPGCTSSSSSGGSGGGIGNYQACGSDGECPAGQGCDTEGGNISPGYCTPLCDNDSQCPVGYDCPSGIQNQPGECDDVGSHAGRGICDQFNGAHGPTTCAPSGSGGSGGVGPGSLSPCSSDSECPSGEGCDTEGGSLSPGYCTPLCDNDTQCPTGYGCPGLIPGQPGECDDLGEHLGRGICDQYDGVNGPNTCGGGSGGSSGVGGSSGAGGAGGSGGLPPGPVDSACQSCGLSSCGTEANACIGDSTCSSCILSDASAPGCQENAAVQALLACACSACASECAAYCG